MPTCQQTMSVTVSGPFTIGPTVSPSSTSSQHRGSAPRRRSAAYCGVDARRSRRRCTARARWRRTSCFSRALLRSVRIISRYWPDSIVPSSSRNTLAGPLVHRPLGELARLVEHRHQRVAPPDAVVGSQRRPPLARAGRVEGVHAAQRVALHQLALVVGDRGDLVLADQGVAARPAAAARSGRPSTDCGRVLGVAPQRVVVAVGLGHDCGTRRCSGASSADGAGPRLGHADAGAQACDALVGDGPRRRLGHRSMEYTMRPPGAPGAVEQEHA